MTTTTSPEGAAAAAAAATRPPRGWRRRTPYGLAWAEMTKRNLFLLFTFYFIYLFIYS
jgi:hypothetical protein